MGPNGLGEPAGVCGCVTEPRRLGDTDGHGLPLAVMSTLVTAPQSPQWCRIGRVGLCFSFFKTEANALCYENRAHTGHPHR